MGADVCGPNFPDFATFTATVEDGTIAPERFENMVHRILRTYFKDGILDHPLEALRTRSPPTPALPDDVVAESDQTAYDIAVNAPCCCATRRRPCRSPRTIWTRSL